MRSGLHPDHVDRREFTVNVALQQAWDHLRREGDARAQRGLRHDRGQAQCKERDGAQKTADRKAKAAHGGAPQEIGQNVYQCRTLPFAMQTSARASFNPEPEATAD